MDLNAFTGKNSLEDFDGFYKTAVEKLGGPKAVKPYIPFDMETLIKSYARDENFNTILTPMTRWDAASGIDVQPQTGKLIPCGGIWPLLHAHGITSVSQSQNVCILKTAAAMLVEETMKERT